VLNKLSHRQNRSLDTELTDDQRDHRRAIATSQFQAFDQLLYLPDLNILLRFTGLRGTHVGRGGATRIY
jgi:hypothetical protein